MPSKRKVAKKMKRAINRAKAKGHTKPKKSADNAENNKNIIKSDFYNEDSLI